MKERIKKERMKNNQRKNNLVFVLIMVFICILFFGVGLLMFISSNNKKETYDMVNATIVDIKEYRSGDGDKDYDVYVDFTYKNKIYDNLKINSWNSNMEVNGEIELYINPETGNIADVNTLKTIGLIFMGISSFCFLFILLIVKQLKKGKNFSNF